MLNFACDYLDAAHPKVFEALMKNNFVKTGCYDESESEGLLSPAFAMLPVKKFALPAACRMLKFVFFPAERRPTRW